MIHSGCGKYSDSSSGAGVTWFREPTMTTGASRWSKATWDTFAAIVCMTEPRSTASDDSTRRPVFFTEESSTE